MKPNTEQNTAHSPVFLVICAIEYEGDCVEGVFHNQQKAIALRDELRSKHSTFLRFRVEEWQDGDTEGKEIES